MNFKTLLCQFTHAIETGDISGFRELFTENGVYDDVFYGRFQGKQAIGEMLENHFHGNARAFRWDMHDPVITDDIGYANYTFSYTSTMPHSQGKRVVFTGCARFILSNEKIAHYQEWAYGLAGLSQLDVPENLIARQAQREATRILESKLGQSHKTFTL